MSRSIVFAPLYAAFFVFVTAPTSASAQDDAVLEEIVVTADFRDRQAAELPPSISVLDRGAIESRGVQHFEELIFSLPNLNWSGDGHRARHLQIRGIGELEQYEGAPNPSVGFLIDDIDFSGIASIATLFDVRQVEVLRGPQGTRYGANALAGLIYVQTAGPGDAPGLVKLTAGGDDTRAGGVAFGASRGDFGYRVAGHYHESNGFRDNPFLGREDTNGRRETMLRARLDWTPADWRVKLATLAVDVDNGYDAFAIDNSLTMLSDRPGEDAQQSTGASLRAEWDGSDIVQFTSITTAADSDIDFSFDADWGNPAAWTPFTYDFISSSRRDRRTVSQEFRLASGPDGRLFDRRGDWIAGFYAMQLDEDFSSLNRGVYTDPIADFTFSVDDTLGSRFEALSLAAFGQLDIETGDRGLLTLGLRIERRDADYEDSAGLGLSPAETMAGGELRYRHDLDEGLSLFAGLSRGYKAGGFNLGQVPNGRREFEQEALWSVEAGFRSRWLADRLAWNLLLFYNLRDDQQVRTSFQLVPNDPASFVFFTDNAATGRTVGLESELRYFAGEAWSWYVNLGLLDAEFDEFRTPQVDLSGRDQAHAPRYTLAAGAEWRHPSGWFARADAVARDEFFFDVSHDQRSERYELVNARLGYDAETWRVQLWARNLFDRRHAVRGFFFGNEPPAFPPELYIRQGDPRHLGVTFDWRF